MEKRFWRVVSLLILAAALLGPWTFERIHVPAEYACNPPFIRLEGDFCAEPISGAWLFSYVAQGIFSTTIAVITGTTFFAERAREYLIMLLIYLFVLPMLSTPLVIWKGNSRRLQTFHLIALGLSTILSIFVIVDRVFLDSRPFLWAPLLFVCVVIGTLVFEMRTFVAAKRWKAE